MNVRSVTSLTIYMLSNMKISRYICMIAVFLAAWSCTGTADEASVPVLWASRTEMDLSEGASVTFTVTYNGTDVTDESEIFMHGVEASVGNVFEPEEEGEYVFWSVYEGKRSSEISVRVTDSNRETASVYDKHVCVMEFTGAWCVNCPAGVDNLNLTLSKSVFRKYKENIHICALHSTNGGSKDDMAIQASDDIMSLFTLDFPSYAVDLRTSGTLTSGGMSTCQSNILAAFEEYGAHCGVAVSSSLGADRKTAEVTVRVASEKTGGYRVVIMVVEDKVKGPQKTPTYPGTDSVHPDGDPNYIHRHVVRQVVTSYKGRFTGERMTEDGIIAAGSEASAVWTVAIPSDWNLSNTEIYALVLDTEGYVNNMNVCPIDGGNSGYDMEMIK